VAQFLLYTLAEVLMSAILVPVDFSDCFPDVIEQADRLAEGLGAKIVLLHVVVLPTEIPTDTLFIPPHGTTPQSASRYLLAQARVQVEQVQKTLQARGREVSTIVIEGFVADEVLRLAGELHAELIVMGTHGRTGVGRMLLGSVAESIIRRAPCPVVAVRFKHRPECAARSCTWCSSGISDAMRDVEALGVG
jgi:universal stress protein A